MVSFFILSTPLLVVRGSPPGTVSCSNRPSPIIAPSNARSAHPTFHSSRSIRVRRAVSLRRLASWPRPIAGCGAAGSYVRIARIGGAPSPKRGLVRTEGALRRSRGLVKDRTAARNRGKVLTLSLLKRQNAQRLEQIDRQIATVEAAITPPTSQAWRRSPDSQGVGPVAHSFAAVAPTSANRSPCPPSSPLASIQT
jgi:hypothetical protein